MSGFGFNAGCDHGNAHDALQIFIKGRAEDDIGVRIHFFPDTVCSFVDFEQGHVRTAGDVDQHAAGALERDFVEQRVVDGALCGLDRAILALGLAGAHHRLAHLVHHRPDVGEVEVDLLAPYAGIIISREVMAVVNEGDAVFHLAQVVHDDPAGAVEDLASQLETSPLFDEDEII